MQTHSKTQQLNCQNIPNWPDLPYHIHPDRLNIVQIALQCSQCVITAQDNVSCLLMVERVLRARLLCAVEVVLHDLQQSICAVHQGTEAVH